MLDRVFDQEMLLFSIPAVVGTGVFVLKMGLMVLGGAADGLDADVDVDLDVDVDADATDSTDAFRLLSLQSVAAFAMGFGTGGLAARLGMELPVSTSAVAGVAFGGVLVWLLGLIMKAVYDLESHGNVDIHTAVGLEGTVESLVPPVGDGRGRVRVVIDERMRIYDAVSTGTALSSRTRVRVLEANHDNTLTVAAV